MTSVRERIEDLSSRAGRHLDDLEAEFDDLERALREGEFDDDRLDSAAEQLRGLWRVADEAEDLTDAIELSKLPDSVDASELAKAVEAGEIPDAIREGDAGEAVSVKQLVRAIELRDLFDATDVRSLWKEKRELDEAMAETFGSEDEGDETLLQKATPDADGDDGLSVGADDVDVSADDVTDFDGPSDFDPEAAENAIQRKVMAGAEEFRQGLLEAHDKLKAMHEANEERTNRQDRGTNSRNPTAVSLLPTERPDMGGVVRHSTVPRETRHSSAPNKRRVYGDRFEDETGGDDE